ncbi:energy transducer TonB [Ramlibacter tataouinensis]|uniref:Energy transducer TonB n=1 Tax=Ramlibacter tataouinensis TaxID=94132 RepID=A0A127JZ31_9BURK|nr:TonB family protein [Ramlibacter tataouinensis]AMO25246.1 energy transducer TonB [Ramlibacter tataouinensis]
MRSPSLSSLRSLSTLQIALGISFAIHAGLLTFRFVDPEGFNRVFEDSPLEVILVNANTNERPDKAQAIAQASLAGGGEAQKGRATSPLPPSALTSIGDSAEDMQRQAEMQMLQQQTLLLAQKRQEVLAMKPPELSQVNKTEVAAFEEKRKHQLKILAEIERRISEENARPRKRYVTPATREEVFAIYYDMLRRKIEDKGTRNFPEVAGKRLYGQLVVQVTVGFNGQVTEALIERSSGNPTLDRRAQAIAKSAGPFGTVPAKVQATLGKSGYNRLAFIQTFTFARDGTLETKLVERQGT